MNCGVRRARVSLAIISGTQALPYSSYPSAVTTPSARSRTTQVAMQALKRPASLPVPAPLP
jgi:hypothetical protein